MSFHLVNLLLRRTNRIVKAKDTLWYEKIVEKMLWNEKSSHHDIEQQWELEPWSLNFWTKALSIKLRLQPFALKSICDWVFASFLDGKPFDGSRSGIRRGYWADLPRT